MKIRVTSSAHVSAGKMLRSVTTSLEDALSPTFANAYYGADITQFTIIIMSTWEDHNKNELISRRQSKVGTFLHPITKEKIKHLCFSFPFDQKELGDMTENEMRVALCTALLKRLEKPGIKIPKEFNYEKFSINIRVEIRYYLNTYSN